jgi:hypothetical protein
MRASTGCLSSACSLPTWEAAAGFPSICASAQDLKRKAEANGADGGPDAKSAKADEQVRLTWLVPSTTAAIDLERELVLNQKQPLTASVPVVQPVTVLTLTP